jgi:carbon-monoxide dehydrogenase iron sulfur subunit
MTAKTLSIDPSKCTGCEDCVRVCALRHGGVDNPARSRIHIIQGDTCSGFFLPVTCQQCENAPCLSVCPNKAIWRDDKLSRVMIRPDLCIGCQMCVSACPFGVMAFNRDRGIAFKCDLCDGTPECVRVCEPKALDYVDADRLNDQRLQESALRHNQAMRLAAM